MQSLPHTLRLKIIVMACALCSPAFAEPPPGASRTGSAWNWHFAINRQEPGWTVGRESRTGLRTVTDDDSDAVSDHTFTPDEDGRRSDTLHFLAYQFAAIAFLYAMPESFSGWSTEQKESYSIGKWWSNVRSPQLDTDDHYINYVLHPYWGGAYYVRSRERGYGKYSSFWYAATLSAFYEFGAEALFEEPSIQDLIATPVGGWVVGEYFMRVRKRVMAQHEVGTRLPLGTRFILTVTDPLGAANRTIDGWLGSEERFNMRPMVFTVPVSQPVELNGLNQAEDEMMFVLSFTYRW